MRTKKLLKSFPEIPKKRLIKSISKGRKLGLSNLQILRLFTFCKKYGLRIRILSKALGELASKYELTSKNLSNFGYVINHKGLKLSPDQMPYFPMNGRCS